MLTITEQTDTMRRLCLEGRLTADRQEARLPEVVQRLVDHGARLIVLDFAGVSYMDSTCLSEVIGARQRVERCGGRLTMVNVSPQVGHLLQLSGLNEVLLEQAHDTSRRPVRDSAA